jgi:hypothetical protein
MYHECFIGLQLCGAGAIPQLAAEFPIEPYQSARFLGSWILVISWLGCDDPAPANYP